MPEKKFWTRSSIVGFVGSDIGFRPGTLVLYENGTFAASFQEYEHSCTYQGPYELKHDTLILKRTDLSELTDSLFTTTYWINKNDSVLKAIDPRFPTVKISRMLE